MGFGYKITHFVRIHQIKIKKSYSQQSYFLILLRIEIDEPDESLLAHQAEFRFFVGAHTTIVETAPYAFGKAATTFHETCPTLFHELFPLAIKIMLRREVRLPRLCVGEVHRIIVAIGILIGQTTERMPELMHHHWTKLRPMGISEVIGVVDAAPTIVVGIHEDDDMFIGCTCKHIVEFLQMESGQIAIAVERVEMRAQHRVPPYTLSRPTRAALLRR